MNKCQAKVISDNFSLAGVDAGRFGDDPETTR